MILNMKYPTPGQIPQLLYLLYYHLPRSKLSSVGEGSLGQQSTAMQIPQLMIYGLVYWKGSCAKC